MVRELSPTAPNINLASLLALSSKMHAKLVVQLTIKKSIRKIMISESVSTVLVKKIKKNK